jgi:secreted Zn-dependent insulinase-like peptidase
MGACTRAEEEEGGEGEEGESGRRGGRGGGNGGRGGRAGRASNRAHRVQEERLSALQELTPTDLAIFHSDLLSHLQIDALVVGNMDAVQSKMLLLELQNDINMGALKKPLPPQTVAKLPAGHTLHVQQGKDADHLDSAVAMYFQIGEHSHSLDAQLQLLCQIMDKVGGRM